MVAPVQTVRTDCAAISQQANFDAGEEFEFADDTVTAAMPAGAP